MAGVKKPTDEANDPGGEIKINKNKQRITDGHFLGQSRDPEKENKRRVAGADAEQGDG